MSREPAISVIVPTLDEAQRLPRLLSKLALQRAVELDVVVVDGGSSDGTVELARQLGARVIETDRGRGRQMNVGASHARHELMLFLHADSDIEDPSLLFRAVTHWSAQVARRGDERVAGHFGLLFRRRSDTRDLMYRFLEAKTATSRPYAINGDQGMLLTRGFFEELGGFDESLPFMEDQRLARAVRESAGAWVKLPGALVTSARRFEAEGFWPRYVLMALMMVAFATSLDEFLQRPVYRPQRDARALRVLPYLAALTTTWWSLGLWRRAMAFSSFARFVLANAWQFPLLLRVCVLVAMGGRANGRALPLQGGGGLRTLSDQS